MCLRWGVSVPLLGATGLTRVGFPPGAGPHGSPRAGRPVTFCCPVSAWAPASAKEKLLLPAWEGLKAGHGGGLLASGLSGTNAGRLGAGVVLTNGIF